MNVSTETLASKLQRELGTQAVIVDADLLARYAVEAQTPKVLCFPSSPDEIAAALRICNEARASVLPWGGGTAMALGNLPHSVDVVIALNRLERLLEHDDANLTATVQAGMKLANLQEQLKQRNQFLALDPARPTRATVGGIVAANANGPRRMLYGGVRDLVIGMKAILASGEEIKSGGKVVKNVAGYDLCKLFVGSLGTLGIITEVTFKMMPLPETAATFIAQGTLDECIKLADSTFASMLLPAAITLFNAKAASAQGFQKDEAAVAVWFEGFAQAVERELCDVELLARPSGLAVEVLRGDRHDGFWRRVCEFGTEESNVFYRLTVPLGAVGGMVAALEGANDVCLIAHAGSGTILLEMKATGEAIERHAKLIERAKEVGGHVMLAAAPPALKKNIDVWGPAPPSVVLMREIKARFDPAGLLNPGRFLSAI
ncbi:MAG TPA: FAD-binding oxidoreductase [Candidatus Acidoferrales bacterium]|nr:FAD-binding oxidoreductase [Candidatus Acidoferrales bacterium]